MDFFVLVFLEEEEEGGEQAAEDLSPGVFHTISMKTLTKQEVLTALNLFISSRSNENTALCLA